jgi:hypothetical protein
MFAMTQRRRDSVAAAAYYSAPMAEPTQAAAPRGVGRRTARNTVIFSVATGLSRVAGLVREIVAAAYFGSLGVHGRVPGA